MRRAGPATPHKRDGTWYLIRRVPKQFTDLDRRGIVRITTGIAVADDPRGVRAKEVVRRLGAELDSYWRGMLDGQSAEARRRFEAARDRARALGVPYMTNEEIAAAPTESIIARIKLLLDRNAVESETDVAAVMGGEPRPALLLSELLAEFEKIQQTDLLQMSPKQVRKWRLPKARAIANLISVIGDKAINAITRDEAMQFRNWWRDRVLADDMDVGTANKDIGHVSKMLRTIDADQQLNLKPVFSKLRLPGAREKQRAAFQPDFVQKRILAAGALDSLNEEARHIVYVVADTGMRPSEVANLGPERIRLDAPVPHVQIRPDGRKTKTEESVRDVPLVGCALAAMKLHPNGFPRYRDNEDALSAIVNKTLEAKKLLPTDDHSLYSLRHTFEDRLTAAEAPEKVVAALMGHKWIRPKYGAGPTLEQKQRWLEAIAFTPPTQL